MRQRSTLILAAGAGIYVHVALFAWLADDYINANRFPKLGATNLADSVPLTWTPAEMLPPRESPQDMIAPPPPEPAWEKPMEVAVVPPPPPMPELQENVIGERDSTGTALRSNDGAGELKTRDVSPVEQPLLAKNPAGGPPSPPTPGAEAPDPSRSQTPPLPPTPNAAMSPGVDASELSRRPSAPQGQPTISEAMIDPESKEATKPQTLAQTPKPADGDAENSTSREAASKGKLTAQQPEGAGPADKPLLITAPPSQQPFGIAATPSLAPPQLRREVAAGRGIELGRDDVKPSPATQPVDPSELAKAELATTAMPSRESPDITKGDTDKTATTPPIGLPQSNAKDAPIGDGDPNAASPVAPTPAADAQKQQSPQPASPGIAPGAGEVPGQSSDTDLDAFGQKESVDFEPGLTKARSGREIKLTRPRVDLGFRADFSRGTSDSIRLRITTDAQGNVKNAELLDSTGGRSIDQAFRLAAYQWWIGEPFNDTLELTISLR